MKTIRQESLFYFSGLILLTLGIALTIQSRLGTSPFDALLVGLYRTVGLSIGSWEIVVGFALILANAAALRRKPEFYAIITSLVTGAGIDGWLFMISDWIVPQSSFGQWLCLAAGFFLSCLGIAIYLHSKLAPNPMDRSMMVLTELTGWKVSYSRAAISIVLVILAFFFQGAIGIGTLINALASGILIGFFLPFVSRLKSEVREKAAKVAS